MSAIGEFRVPAAAFLLDDALGSVAGTVTVERMVVDGDEAVTPYVWVASADFEGFEATLDGDPSVASFALVEDHPEERLYRIEWRDEHNGLLPALDDVAATVLRAEGEDGVWTLRALFPDRDAAATFHDRVREGDEGIELVRLYRADDPSTYGQYEVTDEQREALTVAREAGYFAVPRECSLADVAEELGISRNAASARLRRGQDALVGHTLDHDDRPPS
ncbi:helix-turn-helix domain-containing protein [Halosimplex halophilum]|uniref:helix-turn-helix domain-containing protein n=1 Tax=Halosimplex halophilum TaxID=2559572 RepID=UPI00107F8CF5|nr:bacterio-opsin activator domain-containing protein [Halosimplex halophilum]